VSGLFLHALAINGQLLLALAVLEQRHTLGEHLGLVGET